DRAPRSRRWWPRASKRARAYQRGCKVQRPVGRSGRRREPCAGKPLAAEYGWLSVLNQHPVTYELALFPPTATTEPPVVISNRHATPSQTTSTQVLGDDRAGS